MTGVVTRSNLLDDDREQLSAGYDEIQRCSRSLANRGFAKDGHVLCAAHTVHHVHYGEWKRGHNFVSNHGLWIFIQHRNVNAIVHMLLIKHADSRREIEPLRSGWPAAQAVKHFAVANHNVERRSFGG